MRVAAFALAAATFAAAAQPVNKLPRVGFIASTSPVSELVTFNPAARGFARGMAELGYTEGKTVVIEWRSALGDLERTADIVRELLALKTDVILRRSKPASFRALHGQAAT